MKTPSKKRLKEFEEWGKKPPTHDTHGTDSWEHPISKRMTQAKCYNWRMEGNLLKCDSDFGPFAQIMPTNVICLGTKNGLPMLREL